MNLLNCHSMGLHSFPVSFKDGCYKRIFYASPSHNLYKDCELAIHPHHVDIRITVLDGILYNIIYEKNKKGQQYNSYKWESVIINGKGGFTYQGKENLSVKSALSYKRSECLFMTSSELHTVFVDQGHKAVWLVEEYPASEYYNSINYSIHDLTKWSDEGLYIKVDNGVKNDYIFQYYSQIKHLL